jgi:hypothetical protein
MILKCQSIAHIGESLNYIMKEEKNHIYLNSDGLDLTNNKTILSDFDLYSKNSVKNGFISLVVSPFKEDNLDRNGYKSVLETTLKELKLTNRQYIAVIHTNTKNPHIHVLLNRIDYDQAVWKDSHVAWKCKTASIAVSKKHNLTVASEVKSNAKLKHIESPYHLERENIKSELKNFVKEALFKSKDLDDLFDSIKNKGVKIEIEKFKNGSIGTSFQYKNQTFKASEINRLLPLKPFNDSYIANDKLQLVFTKNQERFDGIRTQNDILSEMSQFPERRVELKQEFDSHIAFLKHSNYQSNNSNKEEELQKKLQKKNNKKPIQLGFKVQI